ncbi:MAG: hypothetical protein IJ106_00800 [Parasporobacterium sp.]|nr:hypothetical protein [Parasporobacterium sp.]
MLHVENTQVKDLLLKGSFGLEKESLRILPDGTFSKTAHPFPGDPRIVRDFCENQTEINTDIYPSAEEAAKALLRETVRIQRKLAAQDPQELLWPFSNPPYIRGEEDVPVARFEGEQASQSAYREYLADRYGKYKMTFSGIHVNFSFDEELLEADFALSGYGSYREYKDALYLSLAEKATVYGWIVTALTAASPLLDSSFVETGALGKTIFNGMASTRCSELGYWNHFTPVLDYTSLTAYAASIQNYVKEGLLSAPRELYYPIRLKPKGRYSLELLLEKGINHIELRTVDLNPLEPSGIQVKDLQFIQLFLTWLAGSEDLHTTGADQVQAVQNFKNAARYDLKTVRIVEPPAAESGEAKSCPDRSGGPACSAEEAGRKLLSRMKSFYQGAPQDVQEVLAFEEQKLTDPENRYAWKLRRELEEGFVEKGLSLAKRQQKEILCANYSD